MSSASQKSQAPKMCKSPKNSAFQSVKSEKIQIINEYENLSTNCTVIGSNNLHLVKKPQVVTSMSPAYSNPSPGYPPSPYSSPASLKSPSPQNFKPPTPQPSFPVMQIIHSSHQLVARPIQTSQPQNVIKLKPHLNILPKPSASPQPSPKPSVSPHIVIPSQQATTIMPTAQPLLLNQMPVLAPGVQLILRPQTTKIPTHVQAAAPQGLILQPSGQPLLQIQTPRTAPSMVRVLTNGVQLAPHTQVVTQVTNPVITHTTTTQQAQIMQNEHNITFTHTNQESPHKKKPKSKKKKLDLANIMKLSGIGDEDDIQFESDTSQSESEPNTVHVHADMVQPHHGVIQETNILRSHTGDTNKRIGNIQIAALGQPTVTTTTPLVQLLNQSFQSGATFQTSQATAAPTGIPLNSFIAPNITINNGLVLQRNGGFKLALGEDGRLVLQHDPTLNQDLQSQLLLQSIFGLNGLVLQPSIDQQVHSQTVQTIQQQSVQTIQQQTVQSQTIQTVQQQTVQPHPLQAIQQTISPQIQTVQPQTVQQTVQQTIQHQTVQSQPVSAIQQHSHTQPMQIVQPQPIHTIQSHNIHQHTIQSQPVQSLPPPTVQAIQSQVHQSIQSQIQGQIQSLLQSQPLQTLQSVQSQPVHSQPQSCHVTPTIQSQHQTVQSQPILKVQPFQKTPPVQTVHPQPVQPIQTIHHHPQQQCLNDNPSPNLSSQTSYVVNLTPDQLEQLKRNGQLTVNGQTIFMQRPNATNKTSESISQQMNETKVKLCPKIKPVKKISRIQSNPTIIKTTVQENVDIKSLNYAANEKVLNNISKDSNNKSSLVVTALQAPPKILSSQNHVQVQPQQKPQQQPAAIVPPSALVQPSVAIQPTVQSTVSSHTQTPKLPVQAKVQSTQTLQTHPVQNNSNGGNQEVDRIIGQLLDDSGTSNTSNSSSNQFQQTSQRVHTIHLTLQQQQHLKSIQLQMQTLSARATPGDTEMQTALKLLFAEQQKILASGKLLPPDKVIYQNNQLTIINPSSLGIGNNAIKTEPHILQTPVLPRTACNETSHSLPVTTTISTSQVSNITVAASTTTDVSTCSNIAHSVPIAPPNTAKVPPSTSTQPAAVSSYMQQNKYIPSFTKAQLMEQQLNTDQNGAVKPDVHTPFRDKADACKRLVRYHCYNQPVLSQKDLNKADEIFELTARHFIDKFSKMVDKYRYLLLKESMRQVQTSELMMLDRMFLAEEQQSLMRLRQQPEESELVAQLASRMQEQPQEEYDEWACIQRELSCLQSNTEECRRQSSQQQKGISHPPQQCNQTQLQQSITSCSYQPPKRSASSDSRLETLKKFRVEKHNKRHSDSVSVSTNFSSGGGNIQQSNNFNVPSGVCNLSKTTQAVRLSQDFCSRNLSQHQQQQLPLCNTQPQSSSSTNVHSNMHNIKQNVHMVNVHHHGLRNMQYTTTSQQQQQLTTTQGAYHSTNALQHQQQQYTQSVQFLHSQEMHQSLHTMYNMPVQQHSALSNHNMNTSSVHSNVNNNNGVNNNKSNNSILSYHGSQSSESESGNNSIDEHVQSAIDSILNLQQNSNLDLDEAVSSILS